MLNSYLYIVDTPVSTVLTLLFNLFLRSPTFVTEDAGSSARLNEDKGCFRGQLLVDS